MGQYLRIDGTNRAYTWTPALAKQKNMVACTEEEKKECDRLFDEEQKAAVKRRHRTLDVGKPMPNADPFLDLDDDGCSSMALKLKIKFPKKATLVEKQNLLRDAAGMIEATKVTGKGSETMPIPPQAQQALSGDAPKA